MRNCQTSDGKSNFGHHRMIATMNPNVGFCRFEVLNPMSLGLIAGVDIIVTTLPRWGWGGGGGGAVEPGGSDDGMTITITISSGSTGKGDSGLQAILAKCVKK